jgi:hypothetical protein
VVRIDNAVTDLEFDVHQRCKFEIIQVLFH